MQRNLTALCLSGLRSRFLLASPRIHLTCISRHQQFQSRYNLPAPWGNRAFSSSPRLYKKKDKAKKGDSEFEDMKSSNGGGISEDPFDLSQLQNDIAATVSHLKDDFSKLRAGGRLNTEAIEGLRVQLSKESKEVAKLGELAQAVPKGGRMVTIFVAEEDVS